MENDQDTTSTGGEGQLPTEPEQLPEPKGEPGGPEGETGAGAGEEAGAAEAPEGAVEVKEGEEAPAKERFYSEEEWNNRQSSIDKQINEIRRNSQAQIDELNRRIEEGQDAAFLRKVEEEGGDVDAARQILAREATIRQREREADLRDQAFVTFQQQVSEEGKAIAAHKMASKYGVDEKELLKAESLLEMENIALKLQAEKQKAGAKRSIKTDSSVPTAKGVDWGKLSPDEKVREGVKDMPM